MSERPVAAALAVATAASIAFVVFYAVGASGGYLGGALAVAFAALSVAAAGWARLLAPEQVVDRIDDYPSARAERRAAGAELRGDVREVTRRRALARWLAVALGSLAAALVVPVRSLGPAPADTLFHTKWRRGARLCRLDGTPIGADDLNVDSTETVFPDGAVGDASSQVVLVRLPPDLEPEARGYVAYSRVCTHAGCPVALYRAAAKQLMCPCHQSVFDVTRDGAVVSGPADHALPRLPIVVGRDGVLRAASDFSEPVGPGFWERG